MVWLKMLTSCLCYFVMLFCTFILYLRSTAGKRSVLSVLNSVIPRRRSELSACSVSFGSAFFVILIWPVKHSSHFPSVKASRRNTEFQRVVFAAELCGESASLVVNFIILLTSQRSFFRTGWVQSSVRTTDFVTLQRVYDPPASPEIAMQRKI